MTHSLLIPSRNIQVKTIAVSLIAAAAVVYVGYAAHSSGDLSPSKDQGSKRAGVVVGASYEQNVKD